MILTSVMHTYFMLAIISTRSKLPRAIMDMERPWLWPCRAR